MGTQNSAHAQNAQRLTLPQADQHPSHEPEINADRMSQPDPNAKATNA